MWDSIWINANIATMAKENYGIINNAAIAIHNGEIIWIGEQDNLESSPETLAHSVFDIQHRWITPGLIDCHTHLVFGGNRAHEFEMRLKGASYEEIAKAGGGILSTVKSTREDSLDELYSSAFARIKNLIAEGVTGIEIKSGYGLDHKTEEKMLQVATKLSKNTGVRTQRTYLGAHAVPPEYKDCPDDYIDAICETILPDLAKKSLVDSVDGFCETIGFSKEQINKVFHKAKELSLPVKLHAEQLSNQHGSELAASYQALSVDHLEYLDEDGVKALARSGTVAVLLPGAFYFLKETKLPPVDLLRKHNVPIAIATDLNPGSSPAHSLLLMLNMACTLFSLTPEEALKGVTINAAKALGWGDCGILIKGKKANFAVWDISSPAELSYKFGINPCYGACSNGVYTLFDHSNT